MNQKMCELILRLFAFQTLLDGSRDATEQRVEMTTLRKVCASGMSADLTLSLHLLMFRHTKQTSTLAAIVIQPPARGSAR